MPVYSDVCVCIYFGLLCHFICFPKCVFISCLMFIFKNEAIEWLMECLCTWEGLWVWLIFSFTLNMYYWTLPKATHNVRMRKALLGCYIISSFFISSQTISVSLEKDSVWGGREVGLGMVQGPQNQSTLGFSVLPLTFLCIRFLTTIIRFISLSYPLVYFNLG